jgi:peptidoglycan-N-acetylglucosamine deacetylase
MNHPWPIGKHAAVSLTYDDGMECHFGVARHLHERGLHATFYLPAASPGVTGRIADWRTVAEMGHELGNHTCFHPCRKREHMTWLDPGYDLRSYSIRRFRDELRLANSLLHLIDGRDRRSFGNTCHNETVGPDGAEESIRPHLSDLVCGARGPRNDAVILPGAATRYGLGCWPGGAIDHLLAIADRALAVGGWTIVCFHGVGEGSPISSDEHDRFLDALVARPEIWTAPVADVLAHLPETT